jgi:predicted membrane channel-forming protein YqfA (hemolysin III family)
MDDYAFVALILLGGVVYVVGCMSGYAARALKSRDRRLRMQRLR